MGGEIRVPGPSVYGKLSEILSGAWSLLSIVVVVVGLTAWTVQQQFYIDQLQKDNSLLQQRVNDIDIRGTRALTEQIGVLTERFLELSRREDARNTQIERVATNLATQITVETDRSSKTIQDLSTRLNGWESTLRKVDVIGTKQDEVFRRLDGVDKSILTAGELKSELQLARSDIRRLDDQQSRIIQALDNTYNTLQEALRNGGGSITHQPTPIGPGPHP